MKIRVVMLVVGLSGFAEAGPTNEAPAWRTEVDVLFQRAVRLSRLASRPDPPAPARFDAIVSEALGDRAPDDPDVAFVQYAKAMAVIVEIPEKTETDAVPLMRKAREVFDRRLPADHPDRIVEETAWAEYASVYGRYQEAAQRHQHILQIQQKHLGPKAPELIATLRSIAYFTDIAGDWGESAKWYDRAVKLHEERGEIEEPAAMPTLSDLARLKSVAERDCPGLIRCHERMVVILDKHPELKADWKMDTILRRLATHLGHQKRYAEARDACIRALDMAAATGDRAGTMPTLLQELGVFMKELGQTAEFERIRRKYEPGGTTRRWN